MNQRLSYRPKCDAQFRKIENWNMADFNRIFGHLIQICRDLYLKYAENMQFLRTYLISLVLLKNINWLTKIWAKTARMLIFGHTFFGHFWADFLWELKRWLSNIYWSVTNILSYHAYFPSLIFCACFSWKLA